MNRRRALAVAMAAAAVLAACGPEPRLRLSMRNVGVTVPRLVAPAVELVPVDAPPPVALPPVPPLVTQLPSPVQAPPPEPSAVAEPAPAACPAASPFAVPKAVAVETVDRPPAEQHFVQASTGTFTSGSTEGRLDGPVEVTIAHLPSTTTGSGQQVRPWRVQQVDTTTQARSVAVYQLLLPSTAAGASAPGVYLVGLAWSDPVRGELTFQPSGNGLFVLPSPVVVAQNDAQYAGLATDPNTLTTLALTRNVRARKRVDACGQLVDTWTVEMTGRLVAPGAQWNLTWTQQIATAYGAVTVEERVGLDDVTGGRSWQRKLVSTSVPEEAR
jgi:hypothetical protein